MSITENMAHDRFNMLFDRGVLDAYGVQGYTPQNSDKIKMIKCAAGVRITYDIVELKDLYRSTILAIIGNLDIDFGQSVAAIDDAIFTLGRTVGVQYLESIGESVKTEDEPTETPEDVIGEWLSESGLAHLYDAHPDDFDEPEATVEEYKPVDKEDQATTIDEITNGVQDLGREIVEDAAKMCTAALESIVGGGQDSMEKMSPPDTDEFMDAITNMIVFLHSIADDLVNMSDFVSVLFITFHDGACNGVDPYAYLIANWADESSIANEKGYIPSGEFFEKRLYVATAIDAIGGWLETFVGFDKKNSQGFSPTTMMATITAAYAVAKYMADHEGDMIPSIKTQIGAEASDKIKTVALRAVRT